jgi:DNA-binding transcriptional ArsR family regulator
VADPATGRTETMALLLKALGNPLRLQVLDMLRTPHTLSEIRLSPARKEGGAAPDRTMSRMAVRQHVEQLEAFGLVRQVRVQRLGRSAVAYVVDHRQLFAVTEDLKELARIRPEADPGDAPTLADPVRADVQHVRGPRLILTNGIYEGRCFALPFEREPAAWRIGRKRGLAVTLDYDPFLAQENTEIAWRAARYFVRDLPGSRNGTSVNWSRLADGQEREILPGDLIGAGRSRLLFMTN